MKVQNKLSDFQYSKLYPTSENVPRMYCTPKVHKPGNPLRPIVDYTGSIGYSTSRYLADILAPLLSKTECHVQNSKDFAEAVLGLTIQDGDIFNSHDVVSLFTNTPIDDTIEIIRKRLSEDTTLGDRTNLTVDDIIGLLHFVLTTTYFQFNGQIYRQKFGAAMGSPVSAIVANFFMENLENIAIETASGGAKPKFWKRYVDDVFEVVNKDNVENLTDHLNRIDPTGSIKFTYEQEQDQQIPFLDTLVTRKEDGSVKLQVYRKKTHTDQYLNFSSHHPIQHKLGVIRTLFDRCENIVSEENDRKVEEEHIREAMKKCGYPNWTFKKVKHQKYLKSKKVKSKNDKTDRSKSKHLAVLPYVKGVSDPLERIFRQHNVATAVKPHKTLRQLLVHPKDSRSMEKKSGLVYKIPCKDCSKVYIGATGRNFGVRKREHMKDVANFEKAPFTRAASKASQIEQNKSALNCSRSAHQSYY